MVAGSAAEDEQPTLDARAMRREIATFFGEPSPLPNSDTEDPVVRLWALVRAIETPRSEAHAARNDKLVQEYIDKFLEPSPRDCEAAPAPKPSEPTVKCEHGVLVGAPYRQSCWQCENAFFEQMHKPKVETLITDHRWNVLAQERGRCSVWLGSHYCDKYESAHARSER
jgi:hypothetical protein